LIRDLATCYTAGGLCPLLASPACSAAEGILGPADPAPRTNQGPRPTWAREGETEVLPLAPINSTTEKEIRDLVYGYFAAECDVRPEDLSDQTNVIVDLEGDSLMLLALLEKACKKYGITVPLRVLGKHLMKQSSDTIGDIVRLTKALVEHGDNIVNVEL